MTKNWMTTVLGILSGLCLVLSRTHGFEAWTDVLTALSGIFGAALGAAAKDYNVTGGTDGLQQTKTETKA
jgi:hypothetical protein